MIPFFSQLKLSNIAVNGYTKRFKFHILARAYCTQLTEYRAQCDAILNEVTTAIDQLKQMKQKHDFVSTKTDTMHKACENLLEEQV